MVRISSRAAVLAAASLPLVAAVAVISFPSINGFIRAALHSAVLPVGFNLAAGLAVAAVLFLAGLVSGLSGFAFSAIAAAILWLLPPLQAVPLMMLLAGCNQLLSIGSLRKDMTLIPRGGQDGALPYILGGLVGVPVGIALLRGLPTAAFTAALGLFLIAYSALLLFKPESLRLKLSGWKPAMAVGAAGGVVGGFSAFPGSMPVVYLGLRGAGKAETRGVSQPYIMTMQFISFISFAITGSGVFNAQFWLLFAITLPASLLGAIVGVNLYRNLSDINFRRAVLILLAISGISLLAKAII
jgi:uncharacterized protein